MEEILKLNPIQLYEYIKKHIKYGFVDKNNNKYYPESFENLDIDNLYILQSPQQLLNNKCAWCWDVVELYRYYFILKSVPCKTYFLEYKDDKLGIHKTHTFILYYLENSWFNIEDNSSNNKYGIFKYNSEIEAFNNINNSFKSYIKKEFNIKNIEPFYNSYLYTKPHYGISSKKFQNWCTKTRLDNKEKLRK